VRPNQGRITWYYEVSGLHVVRRYDIVTLRFSSVPTRGVGIVPQIRSWPFPLASFPIHYSLIIIPFHAVWSPSLTASLNKPLITEANVTASIQFGWYACCLSAQAACLFVYLKCCSHLGVMFTHWYQ